MLLAKSIVLILTVASLTLLTQLYPVLNLNHIGKNFGADRLVSKDSIRESDYIRVNYLSGKPQKSSCLQSSPNLPLSKFHADMKIKFRQSGGYAGLRLGCDLDTKFLSPEAATQLESLVEKSGILQSQSARSENTADQINYEITIETDRGTCQRTFDDLTLPESVLPLLDYLQSHAKRID